MSEVKLTNAKIDSPWFAEALYLLKRKQLPAVVAMGVSDFEEEIERASKRCNKIKVEIFKKHGAAPDGGGFKFTESLPMPEECRTELLLLDAAECKLRFDQQFDLPEKTPSGMAIFYEPIIFSELRGVLIKKKEAKVSEPKKGTKQD